MPPGTAVAAPKSSMPSPPPGSSRKLPGAGRRASSRCTLRVRRWRARAAGRPGRRRRCRRVAPARRKQIGAPIEQSGEAHPFQPASDQHPWCRGVDGRDRDAGPARRLLHPRSAGVGECFRDAVGERGGDLGLDAALAHIIQLLNDPAGEVVGQSGHVQPGEPGDHPRQQPGLAQVRSQCLVHTRDCTFTATSTIWPSSFRHRPRCTWPIEAAAAGVSSNATSRSCQPGP